MKPYQAAERATSSQPATPPVELLHAVKATDAAQAAVTRQAPASQIAVRLGDQVMTLAVKNGQAAAEICREVRGVVLTRKTVPVQEWASALASALMSHAQSSAKAAEALRRLVIGS